MATSDAAAHSGRRRWLRFALVGGLILAAAPLLTTATSDRELVVRLAKPERVEQLIVTWLDGDEVLWRAEHNRPGREVSRSIRLPAGTYRVEVELRAGGNRREVRRNIEIAEDASRVVVPID